MARVKLSAKEVVQDIRDGVDDKTLMEKYNLTAEWIPILFAKLVEAGALTQAELDKRTLVSEWAELADDSDIGEFEKTVDISELMEHGLTEEHEFTKTQTPPVRKPDHIASQSVQSLMVEERGFGEPTETENISRYVESRSSFLAAQQVAEPTTAIPAIEDAQWPAITEETAAALREFAGWWHKFKSDNLIVTPLKKRPALKHTNMATISLRVSKELVEAAERKAKELAAQTGGDLGSLLEILLWEFLDRDPRFLR